MASIGLNLRYGIGRQPRLENDLSGSRSLMAESSSPKNSVRTLSLRARRGVAPALSGGLAYPRASPACLGAMLSCSRMIENRKHLSDFALRMRDYFLEVTDQRTRISRGLQPLQPLRHSARSEKPHARTA